MRKLILLFFRRVLPLYFPGECRQLFLAIWSAPFEPAKLSDYFRSLRVTIRTHKPDRARILLVLKKGTV